MARSDTSMAWSSLAISASWGSVDMASTLSRKIAARGGPRPCPADWQFLRSTTLRSMGRLTLREDVWRLPTGGERAYPVLHVGLTVGVVPLVDREHVLLIRQFRHLTRADSWELPGGGALAGREAGGRPRSASCARRAAIARPAHLPHPLLPVQRLSRRGGALLPGRGPRRRSPARRRRRVLRAARHSAARGRGDGAGRPHHGIRLQGGPARRRAPAGDPRLGRRVSARFTISAGAPGRVG